MLVDHFPYGLRTRASLQRCSYGAMFGAFCTPDSKPKISARSSRRHQRRILKTDCSASDPFSHPNQGMPGVSQHPLENALYAERVA